MARVKNSPEHYKKRADVSVRACKIAQPSKREKVKKQLDFNNYHIDDCFYITYATSETQTKKAN